jgi:hypothetical protein
MELSEKIIAAYPEIQPTDSFKSLGIWLRDDSDGVGAYIEKWEYSKPIPEGLTLGKPKIKTKLG